MITWRWCSTCGFRTCVTHIRRIQPGPLRSASTTGWPTATGADPRTRAGAFVPGRFRNDVLTYMSDLFEPTGRSARRDRAQRWSGRPIRELPLLSEPSLEPGVKPVSQSRATRWKASDARGTRILDFGRTVSLRNPQLGPVAIDAWSKAIICA